MDDQSQQELYKKDLLNKGYGLPTEEPTYMDEIVGALDHGADVVSGMVGGFLNTGQTLVDRVTGVPEDEMIRAAEYREKEFDYIPRTDIGQGYSDTGKELLGKGMSAVSQAWKNNRGMLGETVNSAIDYTEEQWNALPEKDRMAISAGTELGAVAFGGAAASGVKTALNKGKEANRFVLPSDLADPLDNSDVPQLEPAPVAQIESTPIIKPELDTLAPVVDEIGYTSGIEEGIIAMINDPKVPKNVNASQLMALLKKRGAKDDEIEWSTFSDYVDTLGKKQLPLEEALRQARDRAITLEVIEARPSKGGATPPMFSENYAKWESFTPEGGTNYREYKFRFDNTNPNRMAEINETKALEQKLRGEMAELKTLLDTEKINEAYNNLLKTDEQYLKFKKTFDEFDIGTNGVPMVVKQDLQKRQYELKRVATKGTPDGLVYYNKIRELHPVLKQVQMDTRELRGTQFLNEAHWGKQPNYLFFTRITDRNIGGGKSFGIDEMQSDWHQGKGAVADRPYYKLPESKLKDYIQSQYNIAEKRRNSLYNEIHLLEGGDGDLRNSYSKSVNKLSPDNPNEYSVGYILKEQRKLWEEYRMQGLEIPDNLKEWSNDLDSQLLQIESRHPLIRDKLDEVNEEYNIHDKGLRELEKEGYEKFTKKLRPNAPLKNKEKWMTAALNSMLYRAVKDGYDSVSWPNGQTNYVKYGGTSLPAGAKAQLLKMYDVTLPKLISKVAKKMDKDAEIVFGKKSEDSTPRPDDDISDIDVEAAPWDAPSVNRDLLIEDFEKYEDALISQNERPENILGITEFYIREIESFPDRYSLTPRQRFGSYQQDMEWMDIPQEQRMVYEDFLEEITRRQRDNDGGIPKKVFDKPNSAYSHIKITPAMKEAILKGKALFNKGGLVEDEMAAMGFAKGGLPKRTVPYGNSTNPSDQLGDIEFRSEMDEQLSWNALARLGYDSKTAKVINAVAATQDSSGYAAAYYPKGINNNTTTKAIQNQLRSERVNREDYSRIEGGDVMVSASMADEPVWSHEFTHRGIDLVKAKATQDPEDFIKKYGKDTFKFLTGTGEYDFTIRNDEFYTESFDDTEARQDATALKVKDKKGRSGIARTMGSDRNGMRSKLKEYIKDDMPVGEGWWGTVLGVEMGLNQAAEDILKEQGEPEKYVKPETSIWDDIKSSFN